MQRTRNRKSVLGDNPFAMPESEQRDPVPARPAPAPKGSRAGSSPPARPVAAKPKPKATASPPDDKPHKTKAKKSPGPKRAEASATVLQDETLQVAPVGDAARPPVPDAAPSAEDAASIPATPSADADDVERRRAVEAKIRDLESRLETMAAAAEDGAGGTNASAAEASRDRSGPRSARGDGGVLDTAREMLSSDYYLRQWGRIGMRNRSDVVDEFGYDPTYDSRVRPALELMYSRYFRGTTEGIENVPSTGRALIVVNHSGAFPYDGVMLKTALRKEHPAARDLRWLSEDQVYYLPFVGSFITRLGSVRACQENAERLLANDNLVAVFPEGAKGMGRLYRDRYRLQRFGRGGFIRLCLRTRTPIVPCVIVGAEDAMPLLMRIEYLTGPMGLPYLPVTPTFPLLGPLGLIPAPTRWSFVFGPPIQLEGYGPESADDHVLVGRLTERVRATMQTMIDHALAARRSVWFG